MIQLQFIQNNYIGPFPFPYAFEHRRDRLELSRQLTGPVTIQVTRRLDVVVIRRYPIHIEKVFHIISHHRKFGGGVTPPLARAKKGPSKK